MDIKAERKLGGAAGLCHAAIDLCPDYAQHRVFLLRAGYADSVFTRFGIMHGEHESRLVR